MGTTLIFRPFGLLLLVVSPALLGVSSAWGALAAHDDIKLDYVTTAPNNAPGTAISFPNGGGPFWATLYVDNRAVGDSTGQQHNGTWVGSNSTLIDAFYTFSVRDSATVSPGTRYDIQELQERTLQSTTVLSGYGAWVFDKFNQEVAIGAINPRLDTAANKNVLGVYQAAIWMGLVGWNDANHDGIFQNSESMDAVGGPTATLTADRQNYSLGSGQDLKSLATEHLRYSDFLADSWWTANPNDSEYNKLRTWNGIQLMNLQAADGSGVPSQMIAYGGPLAFAPAPVPEPGSLVVWSVLAAGSAGLAAARRRRRRATGVRWSTERREAILAVIDGRPSHE